MSLRNRFVLVVLWAASIVGAGAWAQAQAPAAPPAPAQPPTVISGSDLGFRVDSRKGNTPVGTLVVRVNGQWVEAEFGMGVKRLTAK
jgi:hypothetical protein